VADTVKKKNNVTIRMRDALKSRVEQSAAEQQRSLSQEIEARLESSFRQEDVLGGPEMTRVAYLMASSFAGQQDYANGVIAVLDALLRELPNGPDKKLAIEGMASRVLTRLEQEKEQSK
jgi:hypothetical protein